MAPQIPDSRNQTAPPDALRLDDLLGCPEALDAWLGGDWTGVGGDEPAVDLTGQADVRLVA